MIQFNSANKPSGIIFTPEQEAVLQSTAPTILVNSAPGSGKSQLLREIAIRNPTSKILLLAYNKAIVEDIRRKVPPNCDVATFHSFGLRVIRENGNNHSVNFNKYKTIDRTQGVAELVQKHMILSSGNTLEQWRKTCATFQLSRSLIKQAQKVYTAGFKNPLISGEDMLSLPIRKGYSFPSYDIVLIDECMDMGMDKLLFCSQIASDRTILVGDKNQKLNQFAGSSPTIDQDILDAYPGIQSYEINETFRCPEAVITEAQEYVPSLSGSKPGGTISYDQPDRFPKDSLVICRSNAPLLQIATRCIATGEPFKIRPQVLEGMEYAIQGLYKRAGSLKKMKHECLLEQEQEIARYKKKEWNPKIPEYKYDAILEILNSGSNLSEVSTLVSTLKNRCNLTTSGATTLSTVHSSKGLESENVFIINLDIGDSIAKNSKLPWAKESEENCKYVATTRSLNQLTYLRV